MRFYNKIENKTNVPVNNKYPIVYVANYSQFLIEVEKYLKVANKFYETDKKYFDLNDNEFNKKLFLDIIINASNYDLLNITNYLRQKTEILQNSLKEGKELIGCYQNYQIFAKISKNKSNFESPCKFDIIFEDENKNEFLLPSVLFGNTKEDCYIFSIQNFNKSEKNVLSKKLDRYFRKVNKDVDLTDDIANVSPNAVVSFAIFVEYLKSKNITKFSNSIFMPIRYHAGKISGYKHCKQEEDKKDFLEKHNQNQYNITNKMVNMFFRYQNHFKKSNVSYDNIKQQIKLSVNQSETSKDDNIIFDIASSVKKYNTQVKTENFM